VTIAGPVLGGLVVQWFSWRGVFLVTAPVALFLFAQLRHLPVARPPAGGSRLVPIDHLGAGLLVGGLGTLLAALQFGPQAAPGERVPVAGALVATVAFFLAFVRRERVAAEPIVPLRLFADPTYTRCALLSAFAGAVLFAAVLQLQQLLQLGLGVSASGAGLDLLPMFAAAALASAVSARGLSRRGRPGHHLVVGTVLTAAGLSLLAALTDRPNPWLLAGGMIAFGCGIGVLLPALTVVVQACAPPGQLGSAMSVFMMARNVGGAAGTAVVGAVVAGQVAGAAAVPARALLAGFPVLAVVAVPALLVAATLRAAVVPGLGPRHRA
jgi:MFS family permease